MVLLHTKTGMGIIQEGFKSNRYCHKSIPTDIILESCNLFNGRIEQKYYSPKIKI